MKYIIAGVGPGDAGLVTVKALEAIKEAGMVLVPHSRDGRPSVAEKIIRAHFPDIRTYPIVFPMTNDGEKRDKLLEEQLIALRPEWEKAESVLLPVIGDSILYATGAYLYDVWKKLSPELALELIPGISAYQFAASKIPSFTAMGDDNFAIISGTSSPEKIIAALSAADSAALYKPYALKGGLAEIVNSAGPWGRITRIDRAGLDNEKILTGQKALGRAEEYLSVLLLWRNK